MRAALGLLLLLALLSGCSSKPVNGEIELDGEAREKKPETKLYFYGYKADTLNLVAIEDAIRGFVEQNPSLNIVYEGVKGAPYWTALQKRAAADMLDDIFMTDHDSALALAGQGRLVDLSDLATVDRFQALARDQFTDDTGAVYFLPTCISTYGLYVNEDMLKAGGYAVPRTLEEFAAVCDAYAAKGITPVVANRTSSLRTLIVARGMFPLYQSPDCAERIERINRGEEDLAHILLPGLELAQEMIERGWIDPQEAMHTEALSDDLALFAEGKRPFMLTGGWASTRMAAMNPGFSYSVWPYPVMEDGAVLVTDVSTCVSVNADSEHVKEAKAFVEYLTQPDVIWAGCDSQSSFSPLLDERVLSDKSLQPSEEYFATRRCVIGSDYNLTLPLDTCLSECAASMMGGMSAGEAEEALRQLLAETALWSEGSL